MISTTLVAASAIVDGREISFPSLSGFSSDQAVMGIISPDITQAKFGGLTTYANLPYVHCLAQEGESIGKFDIAILGAPFDTVSQYVLFCYRFVFVLKISRRIGSSLGSSCPHGAVIRRV